METTHKDIFSIFQADDTQVYQENGITPLSDPYHLLGMVITGVENYLLLDQIYSKKFPQRYQEVRTSIKYTYLVKLYQFLSKVPTPNQDFVRQFTHTFTSSRTLHSLRYLLSFFETTEDYEYCILIKNILDKFMIKE